MYLLDTNILIYFFKGQGKVAEKLLETKPDELAVSTITLFELETGLRKLKGAQTRRRQLEAFVQVTRVWEFDRAAAIESAKVCASLESKGKPIGPLDNQIAGVALAHNATLVTHNLREFSRVPKLLVEDWY